MKNLVHLLVITSISATSCVNGSSSDPNSAAVQDTIPPVETKAPNSNFPSAFEGQTRVKGMQTTTEYDVSIITEGLNSPWGIAVLPDNRILVTEKEGVLRIVDSKGNLSEAITGLPQVDTEGQGGLLGILLDPDFANNRMLYWAFTHKEPEGNQTAVAKGRLSDDYKVVENSSIIYKANPLYKGKLHYGGRLLFDKTGHIILTTGERSDAEIRSQAQNLKSAIGKIIRITTDGKPAADNPFVGNPDALPEIYSYGHRNPQGIAFHPQTGDLWETEFGPRGGDELNRIESGKNYGWPIITYGIEYSGEQIGSPAIQQQEGMEQPVYYWDPVLSPSGITFYTGTAIPEWENNLFIGGLSSTHIARLAIQNNKVIGEERILATLGQRFRDIIQGNNAELYTITDSGKLYKIAKK